MDKSGERFSGNRQFLTPLIICLKRAGFGNQEIYEMLVLETKEDKQRKLQLNELGYKIARGARKILDLDSFHTIITFGYYIEEE